MKTKSLKRSLAFAIGLMLVLPLWAQVSTPFNIPGTLTPPDYVGWDGSTTIPLEIRHNGNEPIDFYTDSIQRMRLWESSTNTINGFPSIIQNGFVGISDQRLFFTSGVGPFSRLHLVDRADGTTNMSFWSPQAGHRRWMRNGVTFSGNSDQGYVGQKYQLGNDVNHTPIVDRSDMVLHWSNDLEGEDGPDRLRFLFTRDTTLGATYGSRSMEGLEGMRFTPINDTMMNAGIGDFYRASIINGTAEEPTERLHVNDGTLRIDSLVPDYRNDTLSRVMMTDGDGRVHWRPISTWPLPPSGSSCEWVRVPGSNFMQTAYQSVGSNPNCPERDWRTIVGPVIGSNAYKFNVTVDSVTATDHLNGVNVYLRKKSGNSIGVNVDLRAATATGVNDLYGLQLVTENATHWNHAITATARNSAVNGAQVYGAYLKAEVSSGTTVGQLYGTYGHAAGIASATVNSTIGVFGKAAYGEISQGVRGEASGAVDENYGVRGKGSGPSASDTYGVYGEASGGLNNYSVYGKSPGGDSTDWAGYFPGRTHTPGALWTTSDENLKTGIEAVPNPMELLSGLSVKTYAFNVDQYPHMGLPTGRQFGFLASELQQQFPEMVMGTVHPAERDSIGEVIHPAVPFKAVNTNGILPLVVGALQDEHSARVQQDARLNELQELVNEQRSRLDELEQLLAACCANPDRASVQPGGTATTELENAASGREKLHIQPNPFSESTTVYYTLDKGGRAQLMANSADGKELRVLHEATMEKGSYQYAWNTTGLAAGIYYVTLLVDGEPVVKKAVKVDR